MGVKINTKRVIAVFLLVMAIACIFLGFYNRDNRSFVFDSPEAKSLLRIIALFISVFIAIFLNTVLHEVFHYVFGKASGWQFASLKFGSTYYVRSENRIVARRGESVGASMSVTLLPPDMENGTFTFLPYMLGGSVGSLIMAALGFSVYLLIGRGTNAQNAVSSEIALLFGIVSLVFLGSSIIPFKMRRGDSDGLKALQMKSYPDIRRIMWKLSKITASFEMGVRYKDMPNEWFVLDTPMNYDNRYYCTLKYLTCKRFMDMHDFVAARQSIDEIIGHKDPRIDYYQLFDLRCDRLFIRIYKNRDKEKQIDFGKDILAYTKEKRNKLSILRLYYAYELLSMCDEKEAAEYLTKFEYQAERCPFTAEIQSERDFLALVSAPSQWKRVDIV